MHKNAIRGRALMIADPTTGCWNWQAVKANGYPADAMHRVWWEASHGPIPKGMQIDHLCRNPRCVRPAHMELVTPKENMHRGNSPNMIIARTNVCKRGHVLEGENVYVYPSGRRTCRTCHQAVERRWDKAHPEERRAMWRRANAQRRKAYRKRKRDAGGD